MKSEGYVWIDGEFVDKARAAVSVFDHGLLYGDGVFEGIRVYSGRILKLGSHLKRLDESGRSIHLSLGMPLETLANVVRQTVQRNNIEDGYVRLIVTRGVGPLGVNPLQCPRPSIIVIADRIEVYPASYYQKGISLATASTLQKHPSTLSPRVKSLNYLPNMMAKLEAIRAGAAEAVLLNQSGFITECVGENIFIVMKNGEDIEIITPPEEAGILMGITRDIAITLARELGFHVKEHNITRHNVAVADEVFLTGTGAEIVPVTTFDGRTISEGAPGAVTRQIMNAYQQFVRNSPED